MPLRLDLYRERGARVATRAEVVELAHKLLERRVNFRPYGRSPEYGMDCIGIAIWVGREAGLIPRDKPIPPYAFPPGTDDFKLIAEFMEPAPEIAPATLLVFSGDDKIPRHVGLVSHWGASGAWRLIGSIPGSMRIGEFGLLPGLTNNIWAMYDYRGLA
jgi:hypothetical protein